MKSRRSSASEVAAHIDNTNMYAGTDRDAWGGIGSDFNDLAWRYYASFPIAYLPIVHPASRRDVARYAAMRTNFPAIVVQSSGGRVVVLDGAHRLAAARRRGDNTIAAYVGA